MAPALAATIPPSPLISKELLEEVTGCEILSYSIENGSKPGDGFMSVLYAVSAKLLVPREEGDPTMEKHHILFKCFPLHPARQNFLCKTNMFYNELAFYRIWVKALCDFQTDTIGLPENEVIIPPYPPLVGGNAINFTDWSENEGKEAKIYKPLDNFIVMTDLRRSGGFRMVDRVVGMDLNHLNMVFTELAKIHALSWAFKKKVEWNTTKKYPFLSIRYGEEEAGMWSAIVSSNAEIAAKTMDKALGEGNTLSKSTRDFAGKLEKIVEFFLGQSEKMYQEAWTMHRSPPSGMVEASNDEEPWRIQCHGDVWNNNLLFKYNETTGRPEKVALFDFQLTREGCPTLDLAYLIYATTSAQFRKAHLDSLLQLYCDKFTGFCKHLKVAPLPDFGFDSLKRRFHLNKLIGYMVALIAYPNMLMDSGNNTNLEEVTDETDLKKMFTEALGKGAEDSKVFKEKIIEVTQDLYDDGVI